MFPFFAILTIKTVPLFNLIKSFGFIYIIHPQRQDEVPGASFLVEVNAEDLAAGQGDFVEGKDHLSCGIRLDNAQPVGLPGEDGLFVLEAALGAALALHGEARIGQPVAHGCAIMEGDQEEEDIVLVEDVFAEDVNAIAAGSKVEKFGRHTHKTFKFNGR